MTSADGPRLGIVLAQMGGPAELDEVEPFIKAIFADPDLIDVPGPAWTSAAVGTIVSKVRGPKVRAAYRKIGGGSPILDITLSQAQAVTEELRKRGHDAVYAVAMRYSQPDTADAVAHLERQGAERVVMLPLYPHYSFATTGSSEAELRRVIGSQTTELPLQVIRTWHDHPSYLDLQAGLVTKMLDGLPEADRNGAAVVFSAHGLPQKLIDRGDPYPDEIARSMAGIVERIPYEIDARLGYQSRTGPVKWIGPDTVEVLSGFAAEGRKAVSLVPLSFVSDHIETLYEADILLAEAAAKAGIRDYRRSEVFNAGPGLGEMLADIVEEAL